MPIKTRSAARLRSRDSTVQEPEAPRVSSDEQRLNQTERAWLEILWGRGLNVKVHALTFKLAHDTRYTPEFLTLENGHLVVWEVKGAYVREDAWIKLKMAARLFPEFRFMMAQFARKKWTETQIKP